MPSPLVRYVCFVCREGQSDLAAEPSSACRHDWVDLGCLLPALPSDCPKLWQDLADSYDIALRFEDLEERRTAHLFHRQHNLRHRINQLRARRFQIDAQEQLLQLEEVLSETLELLNFDESKIAGSTEHYFRLRECPCCGKRTLPEVVGSYVICNVCGWEDDLFQQDDPSLTGGANRFSLEQSRGNYRKHGCSDPEKNNS